MFSRADAFRLKSTLDVRPDQFIGSPVLKMGLEQEEGLLRNNSQELRQYPLLRTFDIHL